MLTKPLPRTTTGPSPLPQNAAGTAPTTLNPVAADRAEIAPWRSPFSRSPEKRAQEVEAHFRKHGVWPPAKEGNLVALRMVPQGRVRAVDTHYFRVEGDSLRSLPAGAPEVVAARRAAGAADLTAIFVDGEEEGGDETRDPESGDPSLWDRFWGWLTGEVPESGPDLGIPTPSSGPGGVAIPHIPGTFGAGGVGPIGPTIPGPDPRDPGFDPTGGMATWTLRFRGL